MAGFFGWLLAGLVWLLAGFLAGLAWLLAGLVWLLAGFLAGLVWLLAGFLAGLAWLSFFPCFLETQLLGILRSVLDFESFAGRGQMLDGRVLGLSGRI